MQIRGQRYRVNTPTLAIIRRDGQNHPTTIPPGAVVKVIDGLLDGNHLVDVQMGWQNGHDVHDGYSRALRTTGRVRSYDLAIRAAYI